MESGVKARKKKSGVSMKSVWRHRWVYVMLIPVIAYYITVSYTHLDVYKRQIVMCVL